MPLTVEFTFQSKGISPNTGRHCLDNNYLKPKQIDRILQRLLSLADSDTTDLAFVEPLVLFLADLSPQAEPAVFEHYCILYSPAILRAVHGAPATAIGYDALAKLPPLITRIAKISPESITPDIEAPLGEIRKRLAFYERFLSGGEPGEYARLQGRVAADEIKFVTAMSLKEPGCDLSLGRTISAKGRINITGEWSMFRRFNPIIAFEGRTLRAKDPFDEQMETAVAFAEEHFLRRLRIGEIGRLPREYHFALSSEGSTSRLQTRFTGGSAGLAFALLSLAAIDELVIRRKLRLIRSNVAFTGTIDREGAVHAVDGEALAAKVRSVFLSTCGGLVLPTENLAAATGHIAELRKSYPKRSIELVPVRHVLEAYDDERIVERRSFTAPRVAFNKAKRRKKHIAVAASFIVMLATLLALLPPRLAREIVEYRFQNSGLLFENGYGYNFGHHDFGYRVFDLPAKGRTAEDPDDTAAKAYEFFLEDVNGNGKNELLVASVESDATETNPCGKLHVLLLANNGDPLMQTLWLDSLVIAGDGERRLFRKFYYCHGELMDLDGDDLKDHFVFSLTDRDDDPGIIGLISLADSSIQSFAHIGYIPHLGMGDFDGDGRMEIVGAGVSNGLKCAVAVVLDPERMDGSSPDIYQFHFENLSDDVAKYYIKIPRSILCTVPEMKIDKPEVTRININEKGRIELGVIEGGCTTIYYFDSAWRCTNVEAHSTYETQYRLLQKAYGFPDLDSHLQELKSGVEYWTGRGWSRTPTINRSYLKVANARSGTT
jgi:hypothetical protein